jgi:hypothetical protein
MRFTTSMFHPLLVLNTKLSTHKAHKYGILKEEECHKTAGHGDKLPGQGNILIFIKAPTL